MSRTALFNSTVARPHADGSWCIMNRRETGWSSYAFPYVSLVDILRAYRVRLGKVDVDTAGTYVELIVDDQEQAREEDLRRAAELQARFTRGVRVCPS